MMLHLLNLADRAEQIRFLEQMEKEREEEMSKPSIYIFVEGGTVQEVRVTHDLEIAGIVVFDRDSRKTKLLENSNPSAKPKSACTA